MVKPNGTQLAEVARLVDAGELRPAVGRVVDFADATTIFSAKKDGHHPGKTVIRF